MYICVDCNQTFPQGSNAFHHLIDVHEDASPKVKERLNILFDFQMLHYTDAFEDLHE
jgi:hypothetical protein